MPKRKRSIRNSKKILEAPKIKAENDEVTNSETEEEEKINCEENLNENLDTDESDKLLDYESEEESSGPDDMLKGSLTTLKNEEEDDSKSATDTLHEMLKRKKSLENSNKFLDTSKIKLEKNINESKEESGPNEMSKHSLTTIKNEDEVDLKSVTVNDQQFEDKSRVIFYELSADTIFLLSDKRTIKLNKGMLYSHTKSKAIFEMLFSSSGKGEIIEIQDIDSSLFQLFLDCIMGFTEFTFDNAFSIFPLVWKYQIENSIKVCINVLEPKQMDENVCHCLNMATFFKCDILIKKIVDYICNIYNPFRFLENETYCFLLEPDSLVEILKRLQLLDTLALDVVVNWGKNYLKNCNKFDTIKALFKAFQIDSYLEKSVQTFGVSKTVPCSEDYLNDVFDHNSMTKMLSPDSFGFKSSRWKTMNKGDSYTEEIVMKSVKCKRPIKLCYNYGTNYVLYYKMPDKNDEPLGLAFVSLDGKVIKESVWRYKSNISY